mgnify:CR=1 FL=1
MAKTNKTALITGASSGLGLELARLHAKNGDNVILVARSKEKMLRLVAELVKNYGTTIFVIVKDLSLPTAPEEVYEEVKTKGIEVEYLINNAGFGGRGTFAERSAGAGDDDDSGGHCRPDETDQTFPAGDDQPRSWPHSQCLVACRRDAWPVAGCLLCLEGIRHVALQCHLV